MSSAKSVAVTAGKELASPALGFSFLVNFLGLPVFNPIDVAFKSVSGIGASIDYETHNEAGRNNTPFHFARKTTWAPLVLQRGLLPSASAAGVTRWVYNALNDQGPILPITVLITLTSATKQIIWKASKVIPKSIEVDEFNAMDNKVVIEKLELLHGGLEPVL